MYIPQSDPERLEEAFVERYPALNLVTTSNSGAFWGDGDARTDAIRHDEMQFAVEGKYRSASPKHNWPTPAEWRKAKDQLRVRSSEAIRLFVVYRKQANDFQVSIPETDLVTSIYYLNEVKDIVDTPTSFRMSNATLMRHTAETLGLNFSRTKTVADTPMIGFSSQLEFNQYYQYIEEYRAAVAI